MRYSNYFFIWYYNSINWRTVLNINQKIGHLATELEESISKISVLSQKDSLSDSEIFAVDELFCKAEFYTDFIVFVNSNIIDNDHFYETNSYSIERTFQCIHRFCFLVKNLEVNK